MKLIEVLTRRKRDNVGEDPNASQLARVLGTYDLVSLGVGSTLGVGIYVLAGQVAKQVAGPAVVISFFLAALVTAFAGLSYAEFGARVPKAGSAYIYSYYCVGELTAFIIGWSLILEYSIGAASVSKGISSYIDALTGHVFRDSLLQIVPLNHSFLSSYVDFFAMLLCLSLSIMLAFGVKESSMANNIFTSTNVGIVLFFIVTGAFKADFHNWDISKAEIPASANGGEGGFAPFGLAGIIRGTAVCFYGFVGFDCIATTGEEVRNPQRAIPVAILISLGIILAAYLGVSSVITLMVPYYLQDSDAPIPYAYEVVGWHTAKWIISIGALFGLFASLFGALFPLPRIIYAMAKDGLLFRWLSQVHPRYHTPFIGTLISGVFTALLGAFFNLQQLVGLNALGTLLTYALVSTCVLILRYEGDNMNDKGELYYGEKSCLLPQKPESVGTTRAWDIWKLFLSFKRLPAPSYLTSRLVVVQTLFFCLFSVCLSVILVFFEDELYNLNETVVSAAVLLLAVIFTIVISIARQPASQKRLSFKMPLVPYLPCISIYINIHLMVGFDVHSWIRFLVCLAIDQFRPYSDIVEKALSRKWKWAGHVARSLNDRWTKAILDWTPRESSRNVGRPGLRWRNDLVRFKGAQWHQIAQNRQEWSLLEEAYIQEWIERG